MQDDRATNALSRIDAALSRIEAHMSAAPAPGNDASEELEQLRAAHARLRGRVEEAVVAIDRLLEEG